MGIDEYLGNRENNNQAWKEFQKDYGYVCVSNLLELICTCFDCNRDDPQKLLPSDKIIDLYNAIGNKFSDNCELERLHFGLENLGLKLQGDELVKANIGELVKKIEQLKKN